MASGRRTARVVLAAAVGQVRCSGKPLSPSARRLPGAGHRATSPRLGAAGRERSCVVPLQARRALAKLVEEHAKHSQQRPQTNGHSAASGRLIYLTQRCNAE